MTAGTTRGADDSGSRPYAQPEADLDAPPDAARPGALVSERKFTRDEVMRLVGAATYSGIVSTTALRRLLEAPVPEQSRHAEAGNVAEALGRLVDAVDEYRAEQDRFGCATWGGVEGAMEDASAVLGRARDAEDHE